MTQAQGQPAGLTALEPELQIAVRLLSDAMTAARAGDLVAATWLRRCAPRYVELIVPADADAGWWMTAVGEIGREMMMTTANKVKPVTPEELRDAELALTREYLAAPTETLDARIDALRERRRMSGRPEVAALLARADTLRARAEKRIARVDALLAELQELEGDVHWSPMSKPPTSLGGSPRAWWEVNYRATRPARFACTRSQGELEEARALEAEARRAEHQSLDDHGAIEAGSRADLIAQLEALNPQIIGPRLDHVVAWLDGIAGGLPEEYPLRITLVWRGGEIDADASTVALAGPPQTVGATP